MSIVSYESVISLMVDCTPADNIQNLLRKLLVLQSRIKQIKDQDAEFISELETHKSNLVKLKRKYNIMRRYINHSGVKFFISQIEYHKKKKAEICFIGSGHSAFAMGLVDSYCRSEIGYFTRLIEAKQKYENLPSLIALLKDQNMLIDLFSIK